MPARPNLLTFVTPADVGRLPAVSAMSVIGSYNLQVALLASGRISSYGRGMDAVGAPSGQTLWAFKLQGLGIAPPFDPPPGSPYVGLSVDGGAPRRIQFTYTVNSDGNFEDTTILIAAVPRATRAVDLVVTDAGITQRMSLLTGKPADGNIVIYQRRPESRFSNPGQSVTIPATISGGGPTLRTHVNVDVENGSLDYFAPDGSVKASGVTRALLTFGVCLRSPDVIGQDNSAGACRSYESSDFSVTPTGGRPIRAHDYGHFFVAVDVSAYFTSGIVTLNGSENLGNGRVLRFDKPCVLRIAFPA